MPHLLHFLCVYVGMGLDLEIHLEPGLFEWLGWYQEGLPKWMNTKEFHDFGLKVGTSHTPIVPVSKLDLKETTEQYYNRCHLVSKELLKKHEKEGKLQIDQTVCS